MADFGLEPKSISYFSFFRIERKNRTRNFSVLIFYIFSLNFIVKNSNIKLLLRHKGNEKLLFTCCFWARNRMKYTFAILYNIYSFYLFFLRQKREKNEKLFQLLHIKGYFYDILNITLHVEMLALSQKGQCGVSSFSSFLFLPSLFMKWHSNSAILFQIKTINPFKRKDWIIFILCWSLFVALLFKLKNEDPFCEKVFLSIGVR